MSQLETVKKQLGKPYSDLNLLLECFRGILMENDENELANCMPWICDSYNYEVKNFSQKHFHMFSICFQLLNLAETNGAVQNRRSVEEANLLSGVNGLWANSIQILKERGSDEKTILDTLSNIDVQPVLTAHPTEAKRPVILKKYRELYLQLVKRENSMYNSYELEENRKEIKRLISSIWHIDEFYIEKPTVATELDNVIPFQLILFSFFQSISVL